jgi:hypothetical protein
MGEEDWELTQALSGRGEALFGHLDFTVWIDDPTAHNNHAPMDVEPGDAVPDPLLYHHLRQSCQEAVGSGKDLAKPNLGFVLVARALSCNDELGDRTRQPPPAFHRARVVTRSWRLMTKDTSPVLTVVQQL